MTIQKAKTTEKDEPKEKERVLLATLHPGFRRGAIDTLIGICRDQLMIIEGLHWEVVDVWDEIKEGTKSSKIYGHLVHIE